MPEFQKVQYILEQTTTYLFHAFHPEVHPQLQRSTVSLS